LAGALRRAAAVRLVQAGAAGCRAAVADPRLTQCLQAVARARL